MNYNGDRYIPAKKGEKKVDPNNPKTKPMDPNQHTTPKPNRHDATNDTQFGGRSRVDKLPRYGEGNSAFAVRKGTMGKPKNREEALAKMDHNARQMATGKAIIRKSNKAQGKPANTGIEAGARAAGSTSKLSRLAKKRKG